MQIMKIKKTFEIFLFLSISYLVSFAVLVSLVIIPSFSLFMARSVRFGSPAYPLSAELFKGLNILVGIHFIDS